MRLPDLGFVLLMLVMIIGLVAIMAVGPERVARVMNMGPASETGRSR